LVLETVAPEDLPAAVARYEAPELVLPAGAPVTLPGAARTEREPWEFDADLAREDLTRTFRLASLDGLDTEPGDRTALGAAVGGPWGCAWRTGGGATGCERHSTACAASSGWRAAPRWGAQPRASWARSGTRSIASPTCAARSTAWTRGAGRRCWRRWPIASTCSRTWATNWRGRLWSDRRRNSRTGTRSARATTASWTGSRTRATGANATS